MALIFTWRWIKRKSYIANYYKLAKVLFYLFFNHSCNSKLSCHCYFHVLLCFTSEVLFYSFSQLAEIKQKILNKITTTPRQNISFFRFCVKIIICLKNNFAITVNLFKHKKKCSQYKTHNSPSQWEWLLLHFLPFNIFYDHNSWIKIFLIRQTIFFFFFLEVVF